MQQFFDVWFELDPERPKYLDPVDENQVGRDPGKMAVVSASSTGLTG